MKWPWKSGSHRSCSHCISPPAVVSGSFLRFTHCSILKASTVFLKKKVFSDASESFFIAADQPRGRCDSCEAAAGSWPRYNLSCCCPTPTVWPLLLFFSSFVQPSLTSRRKHRTYLSALPPAAFLRVGRIRPKKRPGLRRTSATVNLREIPARPPSPGCSAASPRSSRFSPFSLLKLCQVVFFFL